MYINLIVYSYFIPAGHALGIHEPAPPGGEQRDEDGGMILKCEEGGECRWWDTATQTYNFDMNSGDLENRNNILSTLTRVEMIISLYFSSTKEKIYQR